MEQGLAAIAEGKALEAVSDLEQAYQKFCAGLQILRCRCAEIQEMEGADPANKFRIHVEVFARQAQAIKAQLPSSAAVDAGLSKKVS